MGTPAFYGSMFQTADAFLPPWMSGVELRIESVVLPHPLPWNCVFAAVQLGLGAGLLWSRTVRVALAASIIWSLSVWVFAEGLGGLASPMASIVSGAPGPALVYAWAAALLWPHGREGSVPAAKAEVVGQLAAFCSWPAFWVGTALLQLKVSNRIPGGPGGAIAGAANGNPQPLVFFNHLFGSLVGDQGQLFVVVLVTVQLFVGLGIAAGPTRRAALVMAGVCAVFFGVVGQDFGGIFAGVATDPGTGPTLLLVSAAMWARLEPQRQSNDDGMVCLLARRRQAVMQPSNVRGAPGQPPG